jgi:hypothetical protein
MREPSHQVDDALSDVGMSCCRGDDKHTRADPGLLERGGPLKQRIARIEIVDEECVDPSRHPPRIRDCE